MSLANFSRQQYFITRKILQTGIRRLQFYCDVLSVADERVTAVGYLCIKSIAARRYDLRGVRFLELSHSLKTYGRACFCIKCRLKMTGMLCNVATWFHTLLRQRNHRNLAARTLDSPRFLLFRLFSFVSPLEYTSSSLFVSGSRSRRCLAISPTQFCIQFCGSHETCLRSLVNSFMRGVFNFSNISSFARDRDERNRPAILHTIAGITSQNISHTRQLKASRSHFRFSIQGFISRAFRPSLFFLSLSLACHWSWSSRWRYGLDSRLSISIARAFLPWRVYEQIRRTRFFVNERGNLTCRLL